MVLEKWQGGQDRTGQALATHKYRILPSAKQCPRMPRKSTTRGSSVGAASKKSSSGKGAKKALASPTRSPRKAVAGHAAIVGEPGTIRIGAKIKYCFRDGLSKSKKEKYKWWGAVILAPYMKTTKKGEPCEWFHVRFYEDDTQETLTSDKMMLKINPDNFNDDMIVPFGGWLFANDEENTIFKGK